jgi:hypothetical protein
MRETGRRRDIRVSDLGKILPLHGARKNREKALGRGKEGAFRGARRRKALTQRARRLEHRGHREIAGCDNVGG